MADIWHSGDQPTFPAVTAGGLLRAIRRGVPLAVLVFGGLLILLAVRLIERPVFGLRRPMTPYITQSVCRGTFAVMGMGYKTVGAPIKGPGAVVANHSSWLDIFALNARKRIYFVSKDEVAGWPGIGWLARATGTVFIKRSRSEVAAQIRIFRDRLGVGHKLLFFPEGTTTDGRRVLPFKPALFAAFFDETLVEALLVQPVTLRYVAPVGADPRFYGWWGDMDFGPHLLMVLATAQPGSVTVIYHDPVKVSDFPDRKALCNAMEHAVRDGLRAE